MALDKVKEKILDEAEQKADQIIEEAEAEADDIVSEAKQKAERLRDEAEEEAEAEAEALRRQELASARMKAQQIKMEAKQELIHDAFDKLRDRVGEMDSDDRADLFASIIETVGKEIDIGTIYTSGDMVDAVEDMVDADVEKSDIEGLIIEDSDGSVRYDYSFDSVLENVRTQYRKETAQELFN